MRNNGIATPRPVPIPMIWAFDFVVIAVVVVMRGGEEEGEVVFVVVRFAVEAVGQLILKKWLWMYSVVEEPLPMVMQKMFVSVRSRSVPTVQVNWEVLERLAGREKVHFSCGYGTWVEQGLELLGERRKEKGGDEREEKNSPTRG